MENKELKIEIVKNLINESISQKDFLEELTEYFINKTKNNVDVIRAKKHL